MSKWNKRSEQSTENQHVEGAETQQDEVQSTMPEVQDATEQQVEPSAEPVEGAETGVEQDAKPVVQVAMGIGQFCRHMMLNSSKTNPEILALVLKLYPDAKTTAACIAWYKSDLRKKGLLPAGDKARSTKLVDLSAEELAKLCE